MWSAQITRMGLAYDSQISLDELNEKTALFVDILKEIPLERIAIVCEEAIKQSAYFPKPVHLTKAWHEIRQRKTAQEWNPEDVPDSYEPIAWEEHNRIMRKYPEFADMFDCSEEEMNKKPDLEWITEFYRRLHDKFRTFPRQLKKQSGTS